MSFSDFINGMRGKHGESRIARKLDIIDFFGYDGMCLRNLYVPRSDGGTTEIDLVYITTKGLFVIESKNYSGYIFGNDQYKNWTSTLYAGKTWYGQKMVDKHQFYNPVWQNNSHIKAIKNYLGEIRTYSLIVFGNNCELKDIRISTPGVYICTLSEFSKVVKGIWNQVPVIYSETQIRDMYNRLQHLTNADRQVKAQHIQDINYRMNNKSLICPWCGGELVLRTARKGPNVGKQFYGCSNYPRCKYFMNL